MIGLVGNSGAGKSTVINLICRFYDVERGELAIDGQDIRKIKLEDLRSQIGMVAQESFLFNGSIAENMANTAPLSTRSSKRPGRPTRTSSSLPSRMATIPWWESAATSFPGVRSSGSLSPGRFSMIRRF
jgi:ABC-type methionine transport system ATPase subunit